MIPHLLEVGLTQNQETMAFRMLTTVELFYFIMCKNHAWIELHWNSIWLRTQSHITSHYTWKLMTTEHDFGSVFGWPLDTFGLSRFHGHGSLLVCEVALSHTWETLEVFSPSIMLWRILGAFGIYGAWLGQIYGGVVGNIGCIQATKSRPAPKFQFISFCTTTT